MIYFIGNRNGAIKVGITVNLEQRMAALRTAIPELEIMGTMEGQRRHEMAIHAALSEFRLSGEWFKDCQEVRDAIDMFKREGVEPASLKRNPKYRFTKRGERPYTNSDADGFDLHRLRLADARSAHLKAAIASLENIRSEAYRRRSAGLDVSELASRADRIMAQAGLDAVTEGFGSQGERQGAPVVGSFIGNDP